MSGEVTTDKKSQLYADTAFYATLSIRALANDALERPGVPVRRRAVVWGPAGTACTAANPGDQHRSCHLNLQHRQSRHKVLLHYLPRAYEELWHYPSPIVNVIGKRPLSQLLTIEAIG
jgi:hypothetical protein